MMTVSQLLRRSLAVTAMAALFAGCTDDALLSPDGQPAIRAQFATTSVSEAEALGIEFRTPDLGACQKLQVTSTLAFHVYAQGVQIYRWNGTSWSFVAPEAALFADAGLQGTVGTHYAGPTWESVSGSKVVGRVVDRCRPDAGSIDWLLLDAVSSEGPGIFDRVTQIQRLNTSGGNAPVTPGSTIGEEARVPYTTEYFFYRD